MATAEIWAYRGGLRTDVDLSGYEVEARDGSIGTVDEATNEVGASYLIVDTGPWIFGKHVLLPAGVIERIDTYERRVIVGRTRDEIKSAPEYDPEGDVSMGYRQEVGSYYAAGSVARSQPQNRPRARSTSRSSRTRSTPTRSQAKSSASRRRASRGRSSRGQSEGPTKEELYEQAKRLNIEGRSKMNKSQLARAVGRKRGGSSQRTTSQRSQAKSGRSRRAPSSGTRRAKANPVEVQRFLDGVSYPTRKGDLLREADRSGARREVRSTLERLPEERFTSPTQVSEAIGKLR
ncbi:MAG: DUF2795 domain-containing protein [Gaiellaceae bacterium]